MDHHEPSPSGRAVIFRTLGAGIKPTPASISSGNFPAKRPRVRAVPSGSSDSFADDTEVAPPGEVSLFISSATRGNPRVLGLRCGMLRMDMVRTPPLVPPRRGRPTGDGRGIDRLTPAATGPRQIKSSCPKPVRMAAFFFRLLAMTGSPSALSSAFSRLLRISLARCRTLSGRPARRATWMP